MKRKLIALLLACCMIFSSCMTFANAADNGQSKDTHTEELSASRNSIKEYIDTSYTEDDAIEYASAFMQESLQSETVQVYSSYVLSDLEGNETGYYVTFSDNGSDSGYVLISKFEQSDPIVDFSFEGKGIIEQLIDEGSLESDDVQAGNLIYVGPDSLYVKDTDESFSNIYTGDEYTASEISEVYDDQLDAFADNVQDATQLSSDSYGSSIGGIIFYTSSSVDTDSIYKITEFGSGEEYITQDQMDSSGSQNCIPVALTNIMLYWFWHRDHANAVYPLSSSERSIIKVTLAKNIYNYLYTYLGTSSSGGTEQSNIISGLTKYFGTGATSSGRWNYKYLSYGSSYTKYVSALDDDCPILLLLLDPYGKTIGHAVYCFGYAHNTANTAKYLFVMDGEYLYGRFVKTSYYGMSNIAGYKIWVG